jgi:hypothetical protein
MLELDSKPGGSRMTMTYNLGGEVVNSVELKAMVVSRGVKVAGSVYKAFKDKARFYPDPLKCNSFVLPDSTVVQLTDLAFHMAYIKSSMNWGLLSQLRYLPQLATPFSLVMAGDTRAVLRYAKQEVTEVAFAPPSRFYEQTTSSGLPFVGNAVLQGREWLSFQCLWSCDYACAGEPCQYCYSGGVFEALAKKGKTLPRFPSPQDAAEIAEYAICQEKCARSIQITGGSTFNTQAECDLIEDYITTILKLVPREKIKGEILVYTTPPSDPRQVDKIFAAGADRISCSVEIWDEKIAKIVMPGKMRFTGRKRHLDCLQYIAEKYGPGKACSNFLIGVEPVESCLAGAEYLASLGVVPIASVWIPFGRPVMGSMQAPPLSYYRTVINGLSQIYRKYRLEPPGGTGLNVCMCRDIYLQDQRATASAGPRASA